MRLHPIISLLFVSACLSGCAHTQSPSAVNRLQIQVAQLEHDIEERDKSIAELENKVQSLTAQVGDMETYSLNEPVEEYDYRKASRQRVEEEPEYSSSSPSNYEKNDDVLRVSASPRDVQKALKNAGYYTGKIDGKLGSQSQKAIGQFQKDHNLASDGVVGRKTWQELKTYLD